MGFIVFNATFNNISVISWQSVLLVKEAGENTDLSQWSWWYIALLLSKQVHFNLFLLIEIQNVIQDTWIHFRRIDLSMFKPLNIYYFVQWNTRKQQYANTMKLLINVIGLCNTLLKFRAMSFWLWQCFCGFIHDSTTTQKTFVSWGLQPLFPEI